MTYNMIFILFVILLIPISYAFAEGENSNNDYILTMSTENSKYIPGQLPVIFGTVYDEKNHPITTKISISITNNNGDSVYQTSVLAKEGKFRHVGFSTEETGKYFIYSNIENKANAKTEIHFQEFYETKFGMGAFVTITSLVSLLIVIGLSSKRAPVTITEPIRFGLLTMCTLIPLITLLAIDVQIGQDGVFGIVLHEIPENLASSNSQNEVSILLENPIDTRHFKWIMHFGGNVHDDYQSGITVPIYILVFGMIGGYLRFLYKTQRGWFIQRAKYEIKRTDPNASDQSVLDLAEELYDNAESPKENNKALTKRIIFNNSMQDLSLIFLPPILAIASYFLLLQGGLSEKDALPTFAVVSFAIGLISNEIVLKLESFASSTISNLDDGKGSSDKPVPKKTKKIDLGGSGAPIK